MKNVSVGQSPFGATFDYANNDTYVANYASDNVSVISSKTDTVVAAIPVGTSPEEIAYDSRDGLLYLTEWNGLTVISGTTNSVVATISTGATASGAEFLGIAYDSANGFVYTAGGALDSILVFNGTRLLTTIPTGSPTSAVAYNSVNGRIYAADSYHVRVLSGTSVLANVSTAGLQVTSICAARNGNVFVSYWQTGNLTVISGVTNRVITSVAVGSNPVAEAYDGADGYLYVANIWSWNVSVVNTTSNSVVASIDGIGVNSQNGGGPDGLAYDPQDGYLFTSLSQLDSVALIALGSSPPFLEAFTASPSPAYVGAQVYLNVSAEGGSPPYTYGFAGLPGGCTSTNVSNLQCVPVQAGNYTVTAWVRNAFGSNAAGLNLSVVTFTLMFSASDASPRIGQTVFFNTTIRGFDPPYSYAYSGLPANCSTADVPSLPCAPGKAGSYFVSVNVTDANRNSRKAYMVLTVPVSSMTFAASNSMPDLGQTTYLNVSVVGDALPLHYTYSGLPRGCTTANISSLPCAPGRPGNYSIVAKVTDSVGNVIGATLSLSVSPGPRASISAERVTVDAGEAMLFRVIVTGGAAPYSFSFTPSTASAGCVLAAASELNCTPTPSIQGHSFNISVEVKDAFGIVANATSPDVVVYSTLTVALAVSNGTLLLGQTLAITAIVSGGFGVYSYAYHGLPYGCYSANQSAIGCLPTQAGYYNLTVSATDSNNVTVSATTAVHVFFDFNVLAPSISIVNAPLMISVDTDHPFLAVTPAGGIGPLTFSYSGLPPGCSSEDSSMITCTPTRTGIYHVTVSASDSIGDHRIHSITVRITPARGFLGLPGSDGYYLLGGLVVGAAVLFAVFVLRSRRKARLQDAVTPPENKRQEGEDEPASTESIREDTRPPDSGAPMSRGSA